MLDGKRYFGEFPDEDPARQGKLLLSAALLKTLAAIEKEIRHHIESDATAAAAIAGERGSDG